MKLEHVVEKYRPKAKKSLNTLEPHHLFSAYTEGKHIKYFKLENVPTHMHTSEEVITNVKRTFGSYLIDLNLLQVDRNFEHVTYLLESQTNVVSLSKILSLKNQCEEYLESNFILKLISFIHKVHENCPAPSMTLNSIGINNDQELVICDHRLYFTSPHEHKEKVAFMTNLEKILEEIFGDFSLKKETFEKQTSTAECLSNEEQIEKMKFKAKKFTHSIILNELIEKVLEKEIEESDCLLILEEAKKQCADDATTVTSSSVDECSKDLLKMPLLSHSLKASPIKKKWKLLFLIVLLTALVIGGYFIVNFLTRTLSCPEGEYAEEGKRCQSCTIGCLRCVDGNETACLSCVSTLYLVLNSEKDKQGKCLKECAGRKIKSNYCVADKHFEILSIEKFEQNIHNLKENSENHEEVKKEKIINIESKNEEFLIKKLKKKNLE